jgi:hypothetical protein
MVAEFELLGLRCIPIHDRIEKSLYHKHLIGAETPPFREPGAVPAHQVENGAKDTFAGTLCAMAGES